MRRPSGAVGAPLAKRVPMAASVHPLASASTSPSRAVDRRVEGRRLALLVFSQMLPATLVAPAVRPLFALHHGGNEGGMHAFMSVNMVGAVVAATVLALVPRLRGALARHALALLLTDAVTLLLVAAPLPLAVVLALRTVEGAAHVTMATLLFAHAARSARERGDPRGLAAPGAALTLAVALGHLAGGGLVTLDPRAPFFAGAALLGLLVPSLLSRTELCAEEVAAAEGRGRARAETPLWLPVAGAFVARFSIGCLVVSFALFVHKAHRLSDGNVGLLFAAMTLPFALSTYPAGVLAARGFRACVLGVACVPYAALLALLARFPARGLPYAMVGMGVSSGFLFAALLSLTTTGRTGAARTRAVSSIHGAGCLGMLLGPTSAGIACVLLRRPDAPLRGYTASFALGASAVAVFLVVSLPWLAPRVLRELRAGDAGRSAG